MIIEFVRAGFTNKGAHLMLLAAQARLNAVYPDAILTMAPTTRERSQPFEKLVQAGFYPKASLYRYGMQLGDLACILPERLRGMYGLILDREVDVVIDLSGFAYGDQWGSAHARELAYSASRWKRQGTTVILMPQALGPFSGVRIQKHMKKAVANVDLVMPRESVSYQHITSITGPRDNIRQFPDFTNLIDGIVPATHLASLHQVCLVPNYRMIDKSTGKQGSEYVPFMTRCAKYLVQRDAKPFILVHEGADDTSLAEQISAGCGGIPIVYEEDPLRIKGIIGTCHAMIGSRFHGLVNALSQGVPSLATGWSHKYSELFRDYGVPDGLISVDIDDHALRSKVDWIMDEPSHSEIQGVLLEQAERLKNVAEEMWQVILETISQSRHRQSGRG